MPTSSFDKEIVLSPEGAERLLKALEEAEKNPKKICEHPKVKMASKEDLQKKKRLC